MYNLIRSLLVAFLYLLTVPAHAQGYEYKAGFQTKWEVDASIVCSEIIAARNSGEDHSSAFYNIFVGGSPALSPAAAPYNQCNIDRIFSGAPDDKQIGAANTSIQYRLTCPSGFARDSVTGECRPLVPSDCPAGKEIYFGQCLDIDPVSCKRAQTLYNSTIGEVRTDVEVTGQVSSGTSLCVPTVETGSNGQPLSCTMNFELDIGFTLPDGSHVSRGTLDMGGMIGNYATLPCGASLTPQIPVVKPEELNPPCPPGQQTGQVNGVDVCKPFAPGTTSTTKDSDSNSSGPNGNEEVTTNTTCNAIKCTTTTTTVNNNGTSVTNNTVPRDEFCAKNPTSKQCTGASTGSGDDASGDCEGEAADTVGCTPLGSPGGGTDVVNRDVALTFNKEPGFGPSNSTCPTPRVVHLSFTTITVPWDMFCEFAIGIRPFVLALAYIGAAFTFFGLGKKD